VSLEFHDRRTIEPPPANLLCEAPYLNFECKDRNFADVWCENCCVGFCFDCFTDYHKNRRKNHVSISFVYYQKREREARAAEEAFQLTIKPTSPLGVGDDSLTFCSFPQETTPLETLTSDSEFDSAKASMAGAHLHSSVSSGQSSMPDLCPGAELDMLASQLEEAGLDEDAQPDSVSYKDANSRQSTSSARSFLLVDDKEELQVQSLFYILVETCEISTHLGQEKKIALFHRSVSSCQGVTWKNTLGQTCSVYYSQMLLFQRLAFRRFPCTYISSLFSGEGCRHIYPETWLPQGRSRESGVSVWQHR
jgi:hypothetical protein